jgi:hypothetical protein
MKDKTIRDWFLWADAQGYEWAHKAMNNLILYPIAENRASERVGYLFKAVMRGFSWSRTPEGSEYWTNIHNRLFENYI